MAGNNASGGGARLRFMTCGAVDDGKSTLIGRLLYDCGAVYEDQIQEVRRAAGATADGLDFAFVVDGLKAEREQGITIDVAYRYFATPKRSFLIADAPGHEQYTRNQAAAASQSDVAVVVISAVEGLRTQTRRHMTIAAAFGIRAMIVTINKMDAISYDKERFGVLLGEVEALAARLGVRLDAVIPVAARSGDNVAALAPSMPWYVGPTLLQALESCDAAAGAPQVFRLPVQATARLTGGGRAFLGTVASGRVVSGASVVADPALPATIVRLWRAGALAEAAEAGDPVAVELTPDIDVGRGSVLSLASEQVQPALHVRTRLVWLDNAPLVAGRDYDCILSTQKVVAGISRIEGIVDLDDGELRQADSEVAFNAIADVRLSLVQPAFAATLREEPAFGRFVLVDRLSRRTVAAGVVTEVSRRTGDVPWQAVNVTPAARARAKRQRPVVLWFTGLSGAGKSTICNLIDRRLHALGKHTMVLDGDNLRHGLNADLSFTDADRVENMRRVAHVAALFADAGIITLVSLISPFRAERHRAREVIGVDRFIEVFVDAPLEICRQRDPKGHYARAAAGSLPNFTGVSAGYEPPENPDIRILTGQFSPSQGVDLLINHLRSKDWLL